MIMSTSASSTSLNTSLTASTSASKLNANSSSTMVSLSTAPSSTTASASFLSQLNENSNSSTLSENTATSTSTNGTSSTQAASVAASAPTSAPASSANANDNRWIFPQEKITNSPSRLDGISQEDELNQRQESALFISDLGSLLRVNQLCINTAIIYMHRFYMIHSLKKFHHYVRMVATACLFFACKVEEQPRRLKEFIEAIHKTFHKTNEPLNPNSEEYRKICDEITTLESCLLQTLGFNVLINHAHTVIIKTCQMIKAPRDLAEAAYLTATNSLILTNFCVQFSSEKVACFCIYLACKWTQLIIPTSSEGLQWYQYVKDDIVEQELEDISKEYLTIYNKCLPKIQKKLGKSKSIDETNIHDSRHIQHQRQHQSQTQQPHSAQHHFQSSQYVKKQTDNRPSAGHPPHTQGMHPHNQQVISNVNINPSNTNNQQNLPKQPNKPKQQAHPQSNHVSSNPHHYQSQQYQQQQKQQRLSSGGAAPNKPQQPNTAAASSQPAKPHHPPPNSQPQQHPNKSLSSSNSSPSLNKTNLTNGVSSNASTPNSNNTGASQSNIKNQNNESESTSKTNSQQLNNSLNNNNNNVKKPANPNQQQNSTSMLNNSFKSSPSSSSSNLVSQINTNNLTNTSSNSSMKRGNEDLSNGSSAPNKIPKYVIDQKSAS